MNRIVELSDGTQLTAIGQGAWNIGDSTATREAEISTLRRGVELGLTLIDTAEMYGSGRSEKLVGEAIAPIRDDVYLVDKVLPSNASAKGTEEACERSLRHLGLDHIDLYLLHWPGSYPVEETLMAFERLVDRGLIGDWGVSNVDLAELESYPENPLVNQVLYNPSSRGPELDLFPAMKQREIVAMAYSRWDRVSCSAILRFKTLPRSTIRPSRSCFWRGPSGTATQSRFPRRPRWSMWRTMPVRSSCN